MTDIQGPTPPALLVPTWDGIHPELKARDQWVLWKHESRDGNWTKRPVMSNGRPAKSNDPLTWRSFDECRQAYEAGIAHQDFSGVGFMTSPDDPFVLIDLDHVVSVDGEVAAWVQPIVAAATAERAYIETSVSGSGLHIIGKASPLARGLKKNDAEIYSELRYFTISGHARDLPAEIGVLSSTVDLVLARIGVTADTDIQETKLSYAKPGSHNAITVPVDDEKLLSMARAAQNGTKFGKLFDEGDISTYGDDESRADLALASMLAFWTGPNVPHIERLMRLSKLNRGKWDMHSTYLSGHTIPKALSGMKPESFYDWARYSAPAVVSYSVPAANSPPPPPSTPPPLPTEKLVIDAKGRIVANVANANWILHYGLGLSGLIRFDEFADRLVAQFPIPEKLGPVDTRNYPRNWEDSDTVSLLAYVQRKYIDTLSLSVMNDALVQFRADCAFHPVRDYLSALLWDGVGRLDTWLVEYADAC